VLFYFFIIRRKRGKNRKKQGKKEENGIHFQASRRRHELDKDHCIKRSLFIFILIFFYKKGSGKKAKKAKKWEI
jgi:hypothetical protein